MPAIPRCQEFHIATCNGRNQLSDSLRRRRWAGRIDHDDRFRLRELGGGEDRSQRGVFTGQAVIRREHAMQRSERMRCLHAIGFGESRFSDQIRRAVGGTAVGIDHHGPQPGKVACERDVHRADDIGDRGRVVQRRKSDEYVNLADRNQLAE
jgi:hypothetical protein